MPRRWCSVSPCLVLVDAPATRCPEHEAEAVARGVARRARSAAGRPSTSQRGYGTVYQRNRRIVVERALVAADAGQARACVICRLPCVRGQALTAEHVVPLRLGGSSALDNLGVAHSGCNTGWNRRP